MNTVQAILNSKGEREFVPVESARGATLFNSSGDIAQAGTGFKYATDTLSLIKAEVTTQKFYTVPIADFIDVAEGRGTWADTIFTNVSLATGGNFASGIINAGQNSRFAGMDAAVGKISQQIKLWAKEITYNVAEIQQALESNNWDPIVAKERARKENYDLGIQEVAFIGLKDDSSITGLLNNANVTIDTATIAAAISGKSAADLATFVAALIASYFRGVTPFTTDVGASFTAMPTHFVMPWSDYLGLAKPFPGTVGTYPLPMIDYLEMAFKKQTRNPNFKIEPVAYCEAAQHPSGLTTYALYRRDPRTMLMELPIGYTMTNANTLNNFSFQNVGYGRFGGVGVFRPAEIRYFQF